MSPADLSRGFFCPLCRSNHYRRVVVQSVQSKTPRQVEGLFACAGCTIVFIDPQRFTVLMQDEIVDQPHYRNEGPTRQYPPDSVTVRNGGWEPYGRKDKPT